MPIHPATCRTTGSGCPRLTGSRSPRGTATLTTARLTAAMATLTGAEIRTVATRAAESWAKGAVPESAATG